MELTAALNGSIATTKPNEDAAHRARQLPLSLLRAGESATVLRVRGADETHHHLENLGFVPGEQIEVLSTHGGNTIVNVKGAQVALDRLTAKKVITAWK